MADEPEGVDGSTEDGTNSDAFDITVFGESHTCLSDREKEQVAKAVHDRLVEEHNVRPEGVSVEGYMED